MNAREYYIVSEDGTVIPAAQCVVVHLTDEEVVRLCDEDPDSMRYQAASQMKPAPNLNEIMYNLQMKDA
jgi:hypothetical protein